MTKLVASFRNFAKAPRNTAIQAGHNVLVSMFKVVVQEATTRPDRGLINHGDNCDTIFYDLASITLHSVEWPGRK